MLDVSALEVIVGDVELRPEVVVLAALTAEAEDEVGAPMLQRWVRTAGPNGRPIDLLMARDFGAFEDALTTLRERGFSIRGGGAGPTSDPGSSPPARPR